MVIRVERKTRTAADLQRSLKDANRSVVESTEDAIAAKMIPAVKASGARKRGRPPSGKVRVTLLLDRELVERYRATGPGWQARINDALIQTTNHGTNER